MLHTHAPFPQTGSYGLFDHEGRRQLARIIARNSDGTAVIALPERPGAGGNLTVPLVDLFDGTPLAAEEHAEMEAIFTELLGKQARTTKQRAAARRFEALRLRNIHAGQLFTKLRDEEERLRQRRRAA